MARRAWGVSSMEETRCDSTAETTRHPSGDAKRKNDRMTLGIEIMGKKVLVFRLFRLFLQ